MLWSLAFLALGGYALIGLVLYFAQTRLIYYPVAELFVTPERIGLSYEAVRFETDDGIQLHAWYIPAEGPPAESPRAVLLFFHGNAGNISHRLDSIKIFHRLGLSTFIIDYRGYGLSKGQPTEEGTYRDAEAAWGYLVDTRNIARDKIVVFGRSLGGAVATWLAARERPRALIIESTFTSIPDLAARYYPFLPVRLLTRFYYDTLATIQRVHCPVLVIHSTEDEIIPFHHSRRIFDAANEPKQLLTIQGGHNDGFLRTGTLYVEGLDAFLTEQGL
jgi:Prolyl oligopeptidase family.